MKKSYSQATQDWAFQFGSCWRCGKRGLWPETLDVHHLCSGSSRQNDNLATTAISCRTCHRWEHISNNAIGLLGWLFLKRMHDADNYNLAEVCRVRGRAETAITEEEVTAQRERLESVGVNL